MSFKNLSEFIEELEENNELIRIKEQVSSELEITEITDRISKGPIDQNKALLFENVEGYDIPLLINSLGSYNRLNLAFGVTSLDEIGARISDLLNLKVPDNLLGKLSMVPKLAQVATFPPKTINGPAACQEVVITNPDEKMLDKLPILKCWPSDGGPFITLPLVFTKDPDTGIRNIGMYRLQKYSNNSTGFHVHWHHDAAEHYQKARKEDQGNKESSIKRREEPERHGTEIGQRPGGKFGGLRRIPVAVAIGCDPALVYAATAPLPSMIDETIFAGFLRKKPVELVKCKTIDMEVPANAEIILEGYVDLDELAWEGPFGDHTGFYSLAGDFPVFRLTAMTHRKNPTYMTTIVGRPPQEDCYLGKATERIFLPLLKVIMPEVIDMNLPLEGVFHNCAILKIHKRYPGHAKKIISSVWGSGQMAFTKYVIVVDHDVNVHDLSEVAWRVFANTDPVRDSLTTHGPLDILDHATTIPGIGGKLGIDATVKWKGEGFERNWPNEMIMSDDIKNRVNLKWASLGFN
ncbi:MAG: UbiD family decarboxylase [Candidatus Caenarcaniphilales bacterium]|nr:UbiD family decarboxylase [Candidatus Caenarcaniphilales bacterium]